MSEMSKVLANIPEISFIDDLSLEDLRKEMIVDFENKYEEITGEKITLAAADPSRLILYACTLQIYQLYQFIDREGKQDLLKYSSGKFLENIGALKGVTRLPASAATTILKFSLDEARLSATGIPAGTRVTGSNSNLYFYTNSYVEIQANSLSIEVEATCETVGKIGNGYTEGKLDTIVDLIPYVSKVMNVTETEGGADIEADEDLAERVYLAPSRYSVAGPVDAYEYWVRTFSVAITDVKVTSPTPGEIDIRFLINEGEIPEQTIIKQLETFLQDGNIRPMSDYVHAEAPEIVEYNINLKYYINKTDSNRAVSISVEVENAINEYKEWQMKIGKDINPSELIKKVVAAGAKRVEITEPLFKRISEISVAKLINCDIQYGGLEDD